MPARSATRATTNIPAISAGSDTRVVGGQVGAVIQHPRLLDSSHFFLRGGEQVSSELRRWEPDPMWHDPLPPLSPPPRPLPLLSNF
ncbi:hypothetical protein E2C01_008669 [Portunus trituberculatus]|uniref:Uncharacterized protein n=1 Tax=Portunus trituberculatus TaxID=210409 RepID=A0A5B7D3G5_PORTR|nr:hypothetical protein [Portunus trituberculatus]